VFTLEGLTSIGRKGRPVPGLAESWQQSGDGLTWTFRLRDQVFFHDGSRLTAQDVKRVLDAAILRKGRQFPGLLDVASISSGSNPLELVVSLKRRSAFLLDDINEPITKDTPRGPAGTGPFRVTRLAPDEILLDAHDRYYRGKPAIQRIVLKPYPTVRAAWASMMRTSSTWPTRCAS
jgi:peptide/nickel transport system substrate-binding protein